MSDVSSPVDLPVPTVVAQLQRQLRTGHAPVFPTIALLMALVAVHLIALPHPATTATSTPSPLFIIQHCALALTLGAVLATLVGAVEGSPNSLKPSPFSAFSHTWRESAGTIALVASIVCIVLEVYLYVCMREQAPVCVLVGIVGMLALGIPWVGRERLRELRGCATS